MDPDPEIFLNLNLDASLFTQLQNTVNFKGKHFKYFFAIHFLKTIFNCTKIMAHDERFELSW